VSHDYLEDETRVEEVAPFVAQEQAELRVLADRARDVWHDLSNGTPRDHWVDLEDDASVVAWAGCYGIDLSGSR
jgi:hypothetical protein